MMGRSTQWSSDQVCKPAPRQETFFEAAVIGGSVSCASVLLAQGLLICCLAQKCKEKSEARCRIVAPAAQLGLRGLNNASNTVEAWSPATWPSWAHHSRSFKATTGLASVDKVPGAPGLGALNSPQALVTVHTADLACFGLRQYLPILPSTPGGPGPSHQPVTCLAMCVQLQIDQ